jgi:signal transduction histidine kinase
MTSLGQDVESGQRVLIFALGREAELTHDLLERASIPCVVCGSMAALCSTFEADGSGALLLTEEALDDPAFANLVAALDRQPAWSDVSVLLFAGSPGEQIALRTIRSIEILRNVILLERPIRLAVLMSTTRAALRGRARQYQVRDLLLELRRARSDAERANRLKDEFLATLSHELRTPLNAILGWTSMLTRGQVDPSRMPRVFEALDRNAQSQAQLVADVLDVSRIITGKLQLRMSTVDVCDVMARATEAIRPAAAGKNISLHTHEEPDCLVRGDIDRLQQIFWNLLSNAVKFTPQGGTVSVDVSRVAETVQVSVDDTGAGLAADFGGWGWASLSSSTLLSYMEGLLPHRATGSGGAPVFVFCCLQTNPRQSETALCRRKRPTSMARSTATRYSWSTTIHPHARWSLLRWKEFMHGFSWRNLPLKLGRSSNTIMPIW